MTSTKLFKLPLYTIPPTSPFFPKRPSLFPQLPFKPLTTLRASPHSSPAPAPPDPLPLHRQLAQQALSDLLEDRGLTREDSSRVSASASKYVEMLVDGVRELEEIEGWGGSGEGGRGFKEKVGKLAREKGDGGKVAVLESFGLSLASAMGVARYLRGESLRGLVHKVKYMKEMFFSGSDGEMLIARNARRMMMHLSIPVGDDLQQTLAFFEKIEARRGGLNMLGSGDASFRCLVESFPRLLLLSVESHLMPMVEFLENTGIPCEHLRNVVLLYPPIIFCDIGALRTRIQFLEKVGAQENVVGKMLLKYPWVLSSSIQENYKNIVEFFDIEKVPKDNIDAAIRRWPHLLGCSTDKLKVMVDQFHELGVRGRKLGQVIATSPQLLLRKPREFHQVASFLEELGLDNRTVGKLLGRCPELFATSIENTLKRKLEFLTGIGISKEQFPHIIKKYPELLVCDTNRTLLPRMKYLMEKGLSERDISSMVRRFSPLLGYSVDEVLSPKLEFLVNTMGRPLKDVVAYPRYFSYSLEKKIKPRFWVLKRRNIECSLKDMLGRNDEEFAADFMGFERMLVAPSSHNQ